MKPILHHFILSPNSIKVRLVLHHKGIEFDTVQESRERSKELLEANPRGRTPTLRTDDGAIFESTAINEYLEEKYPQNPLMPKDVYGRAHVRGIVSYVESGIAVSSSTIFYNMVLKTPEQRNNAAVADAKATLQSDLKVFNDKIVTESGFLTDALSLADYTLLPWVWPMVGQPEIYGNIDAFPKVQSWFANMMTLPAAAKAFPTAEEIANIRAAMAKR